MPDEADVRLALQHTARCDVLQACMGTPRSARQISAHTGLPIVSCYRHIRELQSAGLVAVERSAVTRSGKPYDLYRSTVAEASLHVDPRGVRAMWETRLPMKDRLFGMWKQLEDRE